MCEIHSLSPLLLLVPWNILILGGFQFCDFLGLFYDFISPFHVLLVSSEPRDPLDSINIYHF